MGDWHRLERPEKTKNLAVFRRRPGGILPLAQNSISESDFRLPICARPIFGGGDFAFQPVRARSNGNLAAEWRACPHAVCTLCRHPDFLRPALPLFWRIFLRKPPRGAHSFPRAAREPQMPSSLKIPLPRSQAAASPPLISNGKMAFFARSGKSASFIDARPARAPPFLAGQIRLRAQKKRRIFTMRRLKK